MKPTVPQIVLIGLCVFSFILQINTDKTHPDYAVFALGTLVFSAAALVCANNNARSKRNE